MANRRYGNVGGGRSNFNNMQSQSVNPWQGGAAPGMNQNMGQSAFGQLNNPQALALALTSLLTGQQPQTQQQHPPSLLNMPPINPGGYGGGGGGGYGQGYQSGRGRDMYKNRNSRDLDRTNRQNQKKRQQHHDSFNRSRDLSKDKTKPEKSPSKSKDTKSDSGIKKAQETKKLPEDDSNKQDSLSEETEDKKRDWKEEKKDSETNEAKETNNKNTDKDNVEKSVEDKDGKGDGKNDNENEKNEDKGSQYDGIPTELLACTYCKKKMWDAKSFEKHVNGRFHREMMEKLEDDHKIKSDIMRRVLHFQEEKNQIEMSRMRSLGKRVPTQNLLHCNMCDLNFYGHMSMHRRSEGHQKLKQFLHPKCKTCHKEFPHRMEWEHHMLSSEHLKKKAEITKENSSKDDGISVDDNESELENEFESNEDNEESIVNEKVITDYKEGQDLSDLENRLPSYGIGFVKYGKSFVKDVKGHYCRLCNVFFMSDEKSNSHMRTEKHYKAFTEFLKRKSEKDKMRAAEKEEEKKRKAEKADEKGKDDEGNWKRRKAAADDEETVDGDDSKDDSKMKDGDAPYDPLEVDEDEEDNEDKKPDKKIIDGIDDKVGDLTDEMWQEVDKDIGGILESVATDNPKEKSDEDDEAPPETTEKEQKKKVTKHKPGPKSKRGKKNRNMDRNKRPQQQQRGSFNRGRNMSRDTPKSRDSKYGSDNKKTLGTKKPTEDSSKQKIFPRKGSKEKKEEAVLIDLTDDVEDVEEDENTDDAKKKDKYAGIPPSFLLCGFCKKRMWNGASFENHINGRFHKELMERLIEENTITGEMIRKGLRIEEERKKIEMNRIQRMGKNLSMADKKQCHCNMCDVNFFGTMIAHRRSDGHQKLKHFLYPKCKVCQKEFPNRTEWEYHKLSPEHIRKGFEDTKEKISRNEGSGYTVGDDVEEEIGTELSDENIETLDEKFLTDYKEGQNLSNLEELIPPYKNSVVYGANFVKAVRGSHCKLCNVVFVSGTKLKLHLATKGHFDVFIEFIKKKGEEFEKKKAEEKNKNEEENKKEEESKEEDQNKEEGSRGEDLKEEENIKEKEDIKTDDENEKKRKVVEEEEDEAQDDEGNWKRRKTVVKDDIKEEISKDEISKVEISKDEILKDEISKDEILKDEILEDDSEKKNDDIEMEQKEENATNKKEGSDATKETSEVKKEVSSKNEAAMSPVVEVEQLQDTAVRPSTPSTRSKGAYKPGPKCSKRGRKL